MKNNSKREYKKIEIIKEGIKINICIPFTNEIIVRKTAIKINKNQDLEIYDL
ncbi:MAG: hypothetical protein ACPHY8_06555 [Patescibacteria group bacterium]